MNYKEILLRHIESIDENIAQNYCNILKIPESVWVLKESNKPVKLNKSGKKKQPNDDGGKCYVKDWANGSNSISVYNPRLQKYYTLTPNDIELFDK